METREKFSLDVAIFLLMKSLKSIE